MSLFLQEIIREWSRVSSDFQNLYGFTSGENTLIFLNRILDKYLTEDVLDNCDTEEYLVQFASALIYMTAQQPCYIQYVEKLLLRLSREELSPDGERLLLYALNPKTNLKFALPVVEQLYVLQKCKLVEQPLLNQFQSITGELSNIDLSHSINEDLVDHLLELAILSSKIFYLICLFLKDFFVQLEYAPAALNFIDKTLKDIRIRAEGHGKDIVDLYPKCLHSIIILLQIQPSYHSKKSRESVLSMLKEVLEENVDHALILISHFPLWLKALEDYIAESISIE